MLGVQVIEEKRKARDEDLMRREEARALRDSLAGAGRGGPFLPQELLVGRLRFSLPSHVLPNRNGVIC